MKNWNFITRFRNRKNKICSNIFITRKTCNADVEDALHFLLICPKMVKKICHLK